MFVARETYKPKTDDFEDDVIETKTHNNGAAKSHSSKAVSNGEAVGGGGGSGGVVAKALFLLLLVSLSVVVALILVELRGKEKAAMHENVSVPSEAEEEMAPPPPPPPPPAMKPPLDAPEASIPQEPEEEPEPLGATPPLEEYINVVKVVEPLPDEAPAQHKTESEEGGASPKEETLEQDASIVDEVVEVVEVVTPVEQVMEIILPPEAAPYMDDASAPPAEDAQTTEPETEDKGDAVLKEETSEEPAAARLVEPLETAIPVKEEEDQVQTSHVDESDDKVQPEEEQPIMDDEEDEEDEEVELKSTSTPSKVASDEKEEEEEDWSQFGKEGSTGALTDAYLKVETLAEDILALDPQNLMVGQLAPHMAGVLRAMEEGQTEGLLDTLNHIQVILEDVKTRVEDKEPINIPGPPTQDEISEAQQQPEPVPEPAPESEPESLVEAEPELSSEPEAELSSEPEAELSSEPEAELSSEPEAELSSEPEAELSSEPEAVVESQSESLTDSEPSSEAESMSQDEPGTQTSIEPEPLSEPEAEIVSEEALEPPKPETVPETITQTETEPKVVADAETQTEQVVEVVEGTQEDMQTETPEEKEIDAETDTQTEKEAEQETETQRIADEESQTEGGTMTEKEDTDTTRETDVEAETETQSGEEVEIEKVLDVEIEKQPDALTETKDETETQEETETREDVAETQETETQVKETRDEAETQTTETEPEIDSGTETVEEGAQPAAQEQPLPVSVSAEEEHKAPQAAGSISEADIADIEAQIIPDSAAGDAVPAGPPPAEEEEPVAPQVAEGGSEPVPVDEVIPDPIRIEPLQEPAKEAPVEAVEEKQPLDVEGKDAITGAHDDSIVDSKIKEELDQADKLLPENPGRALNTFGALLHHNPKSARAIYGRARSLDKLAETEKSNSKLEQAILTYRSVLDLADEEPSLVPLHLLRSAAERCIERMKFRGFFGKALRVQQRLFQRFPEDVSLRNSMGVTYLLMNQGSAAKEVFEAVLQQWPDDGFAQVHFGFVLKTTDNNVTGGAYYMQKGIASKAEGTQDERFFFHLGDALQRQGKLEEAYKIYDEGVEKGMFLNRYQRSLYNVDRLTSRPIWTPEQTTYQVFFRKLEENWEVIRNEGVALLGLPVQDGFRPEAENLKDVGDWKQYELFTKGRKITANCVKAPRTCSLIEGFQPAASCKRGQVKFSVMQPHTHVHAHTGPTNCRLRAHLGLVVPPGVQLKVGQETTTWEEGKTLIFDDSWEHEVWHEGDSFRLVLIVDVWHPELTEHEHKTLSPI
ncbi:Aspartyl/asparaginyl beta-hydroxylase [Chionoecetes opilio]|uniref:Aspartyl/asparaginyl beta-hydroxylase n=1 Tax=Chionoecetes opilio TaxID=41210 RepID=A0A8J4Y8S4_CHIOP|nr:Aspartyl/asparaginyl beta-hydroxylase [Chionoecetes opilio]